MGSWAHTQTPRRKGYSHSWGVHKDIFLGAQEILFPPWVPLQVVLQRGDLGGLGDPDGQVDQKARVCLGGLSRRYLLSAPACLVSLVCLWAPGGRRAQARPSAPFLLSAPTFQEILGNPSLLWDPSHPFHLWIPFPLWIQGSPWSPLVLLTLASPSDPGHLFHPWGLQGQASQQAQACQELLGGRVCPSFLVDQAPPSLPLVQSCQEARVGPGGPEAQMS